MKHSSCDAETHSGCGCGFGSTADAAVCGGTHADSPHPSAALQASDSPHPSGQADGSPHSSVQPLDRSWSLCHRETRKKAVLRMKESVDGRRPTAGTSSGVSSARTDGVAAATHTTAAIRAVKRWVGFIPDLPFFIGLRVSEPESVRTTGLRNFGSPAVRRGILRRRDPRCGRSLRISIQRITGGLNRANGLM